MELFKDHSLLDKQYVSHSNDGISFAVAYYKKSNQTRFLALVKEFRPTAFKCDRCGPVVFETAVAFLPDSVNWIRDELDRLTQKFHQDKPILGMNLLYILIVRFSHVLYSTIRD